MDYMDFLDNGSREEVHRYVEQYGNVNAHDFEGRTLLLTAILRRSWASVDYLLEQGADPNLADESGYLPLYVACAYGKEEMAAKLVEHGADVNAVCLEGLTALHISVVNGRVGLVDMLMNSGADPLIREENGFKASEMYGNWEKCGYKLDRLPSEEIREAVLNAIHPMENIAEEKIRLESSVVVAKEPTKKQKL